MKPEMGEALRRSCDDSPLLLEKEGQGGFAFDSYRAKESP
jgi:hypothetical protein